MEELIKCKSLKEELDKLRPLSQDDEDRIMQKFRLDWNYHSNHLEGNSLSYGETKALLLFGLTAEGKPFKDHIEITGHNEAINWVLDVVKGDEKITEHFIRSIHQLLLKEPKTARAITPDGQPTTKQIRVGEYKSSENHVRTKTGEIFRFATVAETPAMMNDLITWYNSKSDHTDTNPILLAAEFHYKFIRIHPFDDGNGRTARILMNFILMQNGYPPVIIKTEDKAQYFNVLQLADAGNIEPFIKYIAVNLEESLILMISGAKGESIEEDNDIDKEIALLDQKINAVTTKIAKSKTQNEVLKIFTHFVLPLANSFFSSGNYYSKYYRESTKRILINNRIYPIQDNVNNDLLVSQINDKTNLIELSYKFTGFNRHELIQFNYSSAIRISFNIATYEVKSNFSQKAEFKQSYTEALTSKDIKYLTNLHFYNHKKSIEDKLEYISK